MPKKLFQNIFLLIFINLLIKPFWIFGVDLKVQNITATAGYGLYYIIFNVSFIFNILLDFGFNQFNNREVAKDAQFLTRQFANLFTLKLFLALIYFVVTFLLANTLNLSDLQFRMLLFLSINQLLLSFILYARSNFTALDMYKTDAFFSVFDKLLSIAICIVLLYTPLVQSFTIMQFIYAQSIALALSFLIAFILIVFKYKPLKPSFKYHHIFVLLKQALPYALIVFLMTIYNKLDVLMLGKLHAQGSLESGIYAAGYRLLEALNMIPFLLASLLIPFFTKQLNHHKDFKEVLGRATLFFVALCVPFVVFMLCNGKGVLQALYVESNSAWYGAFLTLLLTFPFVFLTYIFGGFLTAAAHFKSIIYLAFISIVLNVVLNYVYIPQYGAYGAALTTFATQAFMGIGQMLFVMMKWKLKIKPQQMVLPIVYILLSVILALGFHHLQVNWKWQFLLYAGVMGIMSVLLRLISFKPLFNESRI